jgi:hypothetical protein
LVLYRKLKRVPESGKNSMYGTAGAPDWVSVHLQNFSAKTVLYLHETHSGVIVYGATSGAAESLIAQFQENKSIRHEIEILKANETPCKGCSNFRSIE